MEQNPPIRLSVLEDHEVEAAVQELFGSASLLASMKFQIGWPRAKVCEARWQYEEGVHASTF